MGSGADTSELPWPPTSMCSTPADTSAGRCPARPQADTRGGGPDSRGARGQTSPLANLTGLGGKRERDQEWTKSGCLVGLYKYD